MTIRGIPPPDPQLIRFTFAIEEENVKKLTKKWLCTGLSVKINSFIKSLHIKCTKNNTYHHDLHIIVAQ